MSSELTIRQREPLFSLIEYQTTSEREGVFVLWRIESEPVVRIIPLENIPPRPIRNPDTFSPEQATICLVDDELVGLWETAGYVFVSTRPEYGSTKSLLRTFVLRQEALDYREIMKKTPFKRAWARFWRKSLDRAPETFWGVAAGVISGVLTSIIIYLLQIAPP